LLSAVLAQLAALVIWQSIHEALNRDAVKKSRIIKVLNRASALSATSLRSM
jgi:hypothetical protein